MRAPNNQLAETCFVIIDETGVALERGTRRRHFARPQDVVDPWSSAAKRGLGILRLTLIEFRILRFLSSRPNRAFTRRKIAEAVSTRRHGVTAESLAGHVHSLRRQLGFYSDYIQAVPYIGYRFAG
jgi:DNA-binding response OmpR family regulator